MPVGVPWHAPMLQPAWLNAGITSRRKLTGAGRSMPSTTRSASTSVLPSFAATRVVPFRNGTTRPFEETVAILRVADQPLDRSRGVAQWHHRGRGSWRSSAVSPAGRSTGTATARPRYRPCVGFAAVSARARAVGQSTDDRQARSRTGGGQGDVEGNGVHGWHLRPGGESVSGTSHRVGAGVDLGVVSTGSSSRASIQFHSIVPSTIAKFSRKVKHFSGGG